jgi:N-acetylmuramoyl-L-alanine amidase
MKLCISSGHGKYIRGASGSPVPPQLDEVDQARRVVNRVAELLKKAGIEVETFHDNTSHDQNTNLHTITNWHNSKTRDYDVSVHFNAYNGSANGTEVLYWHTSSAGKALAKPVCDAICAAGDFTNRGAKPRDDLYVLSHTEKPCILLEVCFCDNTSDSNKFNENFDAICEAIAESVSGERVPDEPPDEIGKPDEPTPPGAELIVSVAITAPPGIIVNVTQSVSGAAPQDVSVLKKEPQA